MSFQVVPRWKNSYKLQYFLTRKFHLLHARLVSLGSGWPAKEPYNSMTSFSIFTSYLWYRIRNFKHGPYFLQVSHRLKPATNAIETWPLRHWWTDAFWTWNRMVGIWTNIAGWKMDPDWRCISYWTCGNSIATLVDQRVKKKTCVHRCLRSFEIFWWGNSPCNLFVVDTGDYVVFGVSFERNRDSKGFFHLLRCLTLSNFALGAVVFFSPPRRRSCWICNKGNLNASLSPMRTGNPDESRNLDKPMVDGSYLYRIYNIYLYTDSIYTRFLANMYAFYRWAPRHPMVISTPCGQI